MPKQSPAQRRYIWRFVPVMTAYVLVLFACNHAVDLLHPKGGLLILLSVLPALPILGVLVVMGMYLAEERDEFVRDRLVSAMVGGIGITLAITTVWGFLERSDMVPHFPAYLAFPLWCGSFGLVQCLAWLRDQVSGAGSAE